MNNNNLDRWQETIKSQRIEGIDDMIRSKIENQVRRPLFFQWRIVFTGMVAVFVSFALLVNLNPQFNAFAHNNEILRSIAEMIDFTKRNDVEDAFDLDYAQQTDIHLVAGDYKLDLEYVISDYFTISLFYELTYQGEPYEGFTPPKTGPEIELVDSDGKRVWTSAHNTYFEEYQWMELELTDLNTFEPLSIRIIADDDEKTESESAILQNNPYKKVEMINQKLNQSIEIDGQRIILDSLEVGAFVSRLKFHADPENSERIDQMTFSYQNGKKQAQTVSANWTPTDYTYIFGVGQLNQYGHVEVKIVEATFIQKEKIDIVMDTETLQIDGLPIEIQVIDRSKDEDEFRFSLLNSKGNYFSAVSKELGIFGVSHSLENPSRTDFYFRATEFTPRRIEIELHEARDLKIEGQKFRLDW